MSNAALDLDDILGLPPEDDTPTNAPEKSRIGSPGTSAMTPSQQSQCLEALALIIDKKFGGVKSRFAEALGLTPQGLAAWLRRKTIPASRVPQIVRLGEGLVQPEDLRPDLWM